MMIVWAVVYGNYEPPETDSLWTTEIAAQKRADDLDEADDLGAAWRVMAIEVNE